MEENEKKSRIQFCDSCRSYLPIRALKRRSEPEFCCANCGLLNEVRNPVIVTVMPEPQKAVQVLSEDARRVLEELRKAMEKMRKQ